MIRILHTCMMHAQWNILEFGERERERERCTHGYREKKRKREK